MIEISWQVQEVLTAHDGGDILEATYEDLIIDAAEGERHDASAEPTEHPVEEGAAISDHVQPNLDRLSLECVVSNYPTGRVLDRITDAGGDRALNTWQQLRTLMHSGTRVDIETSLRLYEGMVIKAVSAPRDAKSGQALRFTLDAQELRTVTTEEVEAPAPREERGRQQMDRGRQSTEDAEGEGASARNESLARRILDPDDGLGATLQEAMGL